MCVEVDAIFDNFYFDRTVEQEEKQEEEIKNKNITNSYEEESTSRKLNE